MPTNNDYANRPPSHRYVLIVVLTIVTLITFVPPLMMPWRGARAAT